MLKELNIKDNPLSGQNLNLLIKDVEQRLNFFETDDIKEDTDIEEIMKNKGHCIFFHQWTPDQKIGHWVVLVRSNDTKNVQYTFFDSLGHDISLYSHYLVDIIKKSKADKLYVNSKKYQGNTSNVCGRWCLLIIALNKLHLNLPEMQNFIERMKPKKWNYDKMIINLVNEKL